ncbi:MAG: YkgJ family cysteine cluster protein [Nanoarchaeota archaeon]|nr:YkgJ family cysteine cluster protein [Nanoarchaeota archaeon]MBU1704615.1 YkgJ family cysteine cluster protein [Nanoarchaeota archaeon]
MITKDTPLKDILNQDCDRCGHCCKYGTGFLVKEDLKRIADHLKIKEKELKERWLEEKELFHTKLWRPKTEKRPFGRCVFLKHDLCSIHTVKPLQCRVGNCKSEELALWFMLNYQVNINDPESVRQYASYLKTGGKVLKGGELENLVPKDKLKKMLNYELI